jgi:hypothetical protein
MTETISEVGSRKSERRKPPARLLFRLDYDGISPAILCHADKAFASIFTLEKLGRTVRILAFDQDEAREIAEPFLAAIRHDVFIDIASDYETDCWCGAKGKVSELFDDTGLESSCAGTGALNCFCGGDLCVCHYHGETECFGCPDCEEDEEPWES